MATHHDATTGSTESFVHGGGLHGAVVAVISTFFTFLLQARDFVPPGLHITLIGTVAGFFIGRTVYRALWRTGASVLVGLHAASGDTTKYTKTYSDIEAMMVRGQLEEAGAAWDRELLQDPDNPSLRVKVADFHLRTRKDPKTALSHYLGARAMGTAPTDLSRYIQQKLVDLYLGPLADDGKAMAELRRLIDGFPGTREAENAREALAEIKAKRNQN